MRKLLGGAALALCVVCVPLALAQTGDTSLIHAIGGYTYFNRAGATMADERADLEACQADVATMQQPFIVANPAVTTQYGLVGALVQAQMDSDIQHYATLRAAGANYENCMVIRGWRVIKLEDATGRQLAALDPPTLTERLASLVGADAPRETVARTFHNEAALPGGSMFAGGTQTQPPSLSIEALPQESVAAIHPAAHIASKPISMMTQQELRARNDARRQHDSEVAAMNQRQARAQLDMLGHTSVRHTREEELASLPPNTTLLIVHFTGNGGGVMLSRADAPAGEVDGVRAQGTTHGGRGTPSDNTYIWAVSPGHWRLTGLQAGEPAYAMSFCLGAPSFEVGAGEVVYVGSVSFTGQQPRLDLSLDPARQALASAPALAEKVRAASYTNGDTFQCGYAAYLYAYEVDGAPFAPSYHGGSRAISTTAPAVATAP